VDTDHSQHAARRSLLAMRKEKVRAASRAKVRYMDVRRAQAGVLQLVARHGDEV
jgi:hypothetical protein